MLGNCDYAVECGKKLNLKLVGIGGMYKNISNFQKKFQGFLIVSNFQKKFQGFLIISNFPKNLKRIPMNLQESPKISKNLQEFLRMHICAGSDLKEGHQMFTLAFVWQLMRAYTLSLLAKLSTDGKPVTEAQIIQWANKKVFLFKGQSISSTKMKVFLLKKIKVFLLPKIKVFLLPHHKFFH